MFCIKCGEAIPDGSTVCPKCGANFSEISKGAEVIYATPTIEIQKQDVIKKAFSSKTSRIAAIIAVCVLVLIVSAVSAMESGKAELKKALSKEWYSTYRSIIKVLDVDDKTIEYRAETGYSWMNTTFGTFRWKVSGRNTIEVDRFDRGYETYTVELNDDKTVLKITPSLTNSDASETWYHIDR